MGRSRWSIDAYREVIRSNIAAQRFSESGLFVLATIHVAEKDTVLYGLQW